MIDLNQLMRRAQADKLYVKKDDLEELLKDCTVEDLQPVTYAELKSLRDNGQLVAGKQYRITDYVTTTSQVNTRSAGHQFDIIVTADSERVLNENARAIQHEGDEYFANSNLNAWDLKYSLDNDKVRFLWASDDGKGVIYYMRDEADNECYYDFKNIQFVRTADWFAEHTEWCSDCLDYVPKENIWFYTFSWMDENRDVQDHTMVRVDKLQDYFLCTSTVYNNKIGPYSGDRFLTADTYVPCLYLSDNVCVNTYEFDGGIFVGLTGIVITNCKSNTLGPGCLNITLKDVGGGNNVLHRAVTNIDVFGGNNVFHNGVREVIIKNGSFCTISKNSEYILLGYNCRGIRFGNDTSYTTHCANIQIDDFVSWVDIVSSSTGAGSSSNELKNIHICTGVGGSNKFDTVTLRFERNLAHMVTCVPSGSVEVIV